MIRRMGSMLGSLGHGLTLLLPWPLRRVLWNALYSYEIHPTARVGFSWIRPKKLKMGPGASIGALNMCKGLDLLEIGEKASIGRLNWITGFPSGPSPHFREETDRCPSLVVRQHAAITHRHIIDCTNRVEIGEFTTFAGFRSQVLTHSIDIRTGRQRSAPVTIGRYTFVGTASVLLAGSTLPDYSVLAAGAVLSQPMREPFRLYGGTPARELKALDSGCAYFTRTEGFVE